MLEDLFYSGAISGFRYSSPAADSDRPLNPGRRESKKG
jgi:hypothetical protein